MTTSVTDDFVWVETAAGNALIAPAFDRIATHMFTGRQLPFRGGPIDPDYDRLAAAFGVAPDEVVRVRQVHGHAVVVIKPGVGRGGAILDADAIVSTDPDRAVMVRVADCVPVLVADRDHRVVAAVHGGWRGAVAGICGATVDAIGRLGVPPSDLLALVGPSIGPCCYQVDTVVRDAVLAAHPQGDAWLAADSAGKWKLDLWASTVDQLVQAGVPRPSITVSGLCTADNPEQFFSFRREGGTGRQAAAIRLTRL